MTGAGTRVLILTLLTLAACGVRDPPVASAEGGAAGDESLGGGAPTTGGTGGDSPGDAGASGGGAGLPACGDNPRGLVTIAACLSPGVPTSREITDDLGVISNLTVLEIVPGDPAACANDFEVFGNPTEPWVGFRLGDDNGNAWLAQFAIGSVPDDLLRPGDIVDIGYFHVAGRSLSYLSLQRDGSPVIFVDYGASRGATVERGPAVCHVDSCPIITTTRVTVNGETRDLAPEERAEIGGMVIQNSWYEDQSSCPSDPLHVVTWSFLLGGFAVP